MGILLAVNCGKCCCGSRDGKLVDKDIPLKPDITPSQVQATTDEDVFENTNIETKNAEMLESEKIKIIKTKEVNETVVDEVSEQTTASGQLIQCAK